MDALAKLDKATHMLASTLKTCSKDPRHTWMADIDYCPYCNHTPEERMWAMKTKDLRDNKKRDRQPCFVCGKHESITEWHHVTNLKEVAQNLEYFTGSAIELVCLCPNCHTVVHAIEKAEHIKDGNKKSIAIASILSAYTEEEGNKLINLYVRGTPK